MRGQLIERDPFHSRTIDRLRFAVWQTAHEKLQEDSPLWVSVSEFIEDLADLHRHAKLFLKLTHETSLERFARFAFAAGKFPKPAEMRVGVALRDEEFAGTEHQAGTDFDGLQTSSEWIRNASAFTSR